VRFDRLSPGPFSLDIGTTEAVLNAMAAPTTLLSTT
jgi:hypothetical protein